MKKICLIALVCLMIPLFSSVSVADPVAELDYQGKVLVSDYPFTGPGYFKFAIADSGSLTNYWSNDGSVTLEPASSVTGSVYNGVFSFRLGDSSMNAMDKSIFHNGDVLYLRVWFSEDNVTFSELLPSQKLVSSPYTMNADLLDGYEAAELIAEATNGVTLAGDVTGLPENNSVDALQGNPLDIPAPVSGDVITFDGSVWTNGTMSYTETDPIFTNALAQGEVATGSPVYVESDPIWGTARTSGYTMGGSINMAWNTITNAVFYGDGRGITNLPNGAYTETDPVWSNDKATGYAMGGNIDMANNSILNAFYFGDGRGLTNLPVELESVVWVATNGKPSARGTVDDPLPDPQSGYNLAAVKHTNGPAAVIICSGHYGPLVMGAGNVHVIGFGRPELVMLTVNVGKNLISGKQRVHNIICQSVATVAADGGSDVKFHNCRFDGGLGIYGPRVEVQDCYIGNQDNTALTVGDGINNIQDVAIYDSSVFNNSASMAAMTVNQGVAPFQVTFCEIANIGGYAALDDLDPGPVLPLHLYSHNYIKGPEPNMGQSAVQDLAAGAAGPTICFVQNTVFGDVGLSAHSQFYANNIVYGLINNIGGPGAPGWAQAGMGAVGLDGAGNTEHEIMYPILPSAWRD